MKIILTVVAALTLSHGLGWAHSPDKQPAKSTAPTDSHGHGASVGEPGDVRRVTRVVAVTMTDEMRFQPASITVKQGQTVKLVVKNAGLIRHELVIGTHAELEDHAKLMQKFPEMEHDDPNAVTVEPGKTGALIWKFTKDGTFEFGCLMPGHYETGMVGKLHVTK